MVGTRSDTANTSVVDGLRPSCRQAVAPAEAPRRRSLGLFAGAVAFLLGVVFSPSVFASFWSPAAALVLVVAAVGLPRLLVLLRGPERGAASAALVFLGIAVVSAALSSARAPDRMLWSA